VFIAKTFSAERKWCIEIKYGQTTLNVDPEKHTGRPRTLHIDENSVIVKGLIIEGRRVKAIKQRRPGSLTTAVRLLHDGARPHTSARTMAWMQKRKWEVLQPPPHSPDQHHQMSTSLGRF
jgi:hypothetical protein